MQLVEKPKRTNPPKMTHEEMSAMADRYNQGFTSYEVGREFGRSFKSVTNAIERLGLKTRNDSDCQKQWNLNEDYFKDIDTPTKAYLLGFIYADGNVYKNRFKMSLWETDRYFLESFAKEIGFDGSLYTERTKETTRQDMVSLVIYSRVFANHLRDKGVIDNKTNKLEFPKWLPKDLWRYFLHGLFDGDGCITNTYCNGKVYLALGFAGAKGIMSSLSEKFDQEIGEKGSYWHKEGQNGGRFSLGGIHAMRGMNYLLEQTAPFFLNRKLFKYKELLNKIKSETNLAKIDIHTEIKKGLSIISLHEKTPYLTSY